MEFAVQENRMGGGEGVDTSKLEELAKPLVEYLEKTAIHIFLW